jgi:hypothetical protein
MLEVYYGNKIGRGYQQQNAGVFDTSAGILEQSMGTRNRVGTGLSNRLARLHRLAGRYDNSFPTRGLSTHRMF